MKQRPILFSTDLVNAIIDGRKTQTRRIIKPQPEVSEQGYLSGEWLRKPFKVNSAHLILPTLQDLPIECPYGQVDDILYVRETFLPDPPHDGTWNNYMFDDGSGRYNYKALPEHFRKPEHCIYKAGWDGRDLRWKPAIHMPKWASRLHLKITNVHVERLQEISEEDARAEGVERDGDSWKCYGNCEAHKRGYTKRSSAIASFMSLWDVINAKRGYGWDANPFVWVIEFERM